MDPFTIAAESASKILGGITGFIASNKKAQALRNAATQANAEAGVSAQQALEQGDEVTARAATQVAANGGGFVGSAMGELAQLAQRAMFNARAAVYRGATEAQADLYNAKVAKANGLLGLVGSVGGEMFSGAAKAGQGAEMDKQMNLLSTLYRGGGNGGGGGDDALAGLF
jgi:hypothetical protein